MRRIASSAVLLSLFAVPNALAQVQPPAAAVRAPAAAKSLMLTGEEPTAIMRKQRIVRQFAIGELQAQPRIPLGAARANMAPVLNNPVSTLNIARKLRALPQLVQVSAEQTLVSEIDRGLVIHSRLSYRILPGKCRDAAVRSQLADAGVYCFTAQPPSARIAAFADPRDPRYVKEPAARARAVADYQEKLRLSQASHNKHIADFRKALADPKQRAAFVARVGAAEVQRLGSLSDDQLKEEVITSAVTEVEEVMFVPRVDSVERVPPIRAMRIVGARPPVTMQQKFAAQQALKRPPSTVPVPPAKQLAGTKRTEDLGSYIYLTGFTYGKDYEWRKRVSVTVNFCVIFDCAETYFLEPYAGFNYGFGLRFPIKAAVAYNFEWRPAALPPGSASVKLDLSPIDGSPQQYAEAGLASDLLFDGKELVAQAGAYAGLHFRIPIVGTRDARFSVGVDLTQRLPAPFTNGQFTPPAPGPTGLDGAAIIFDGLDLIGGLANYGVAGAQVLPAVKVGLRSDGLRFRLFDKVRNTTITVQSGRTYPVGVRDDATASSEFSLGDPVYNLAFIVTPGIDARIFVDIEIWSDHWDWPVWFPQLEVELPPGGVDFSCHANTICSRDFQKTGITPKPPKPTSAIIRVPK